MINSLFPMQTENDRYTLIAQTSAEQKEFDKISYQCIKIF
jgi:hypothetical protein